MRLVILTSNAIRHKFLANTLVKEASAALIIAECKPAATTSEKTEKLSLISKHFVLRDKTELDVFAGHDYFRCNTLPILHKEANNLSVFESVKAFNPDIIVVYGASIIRPPLLSLLPYGRIINLHLGLSPYYRGSGTNFWPFVNDELEYVGATILNIDAGVDTGDIITHIRPQLVPSDNVHTAGCKVIAASADALLTIMRRKENGKKLPAVKQWKAEIERYYRKKDFNEKALLEYYQNLENGMVARYCNNPKTLPQLVSI
ncbi:MAG: hypothetical protein DHS20C18_24450 [Saprospiraceae bacterium]|nr:MAG: hypothetical protein DHS20C18_24450 [Saprospiraceae bacterium]